jgi:hypothetical protein
MMMFLEIAGAWATFGGLLWAFEEYVLLRHEQSGLRVTFDRWWNSVQGMSKQAFVVALANIAVEFMKYIFGPRIFSRRSVAWSAVLGAGALLLVLLIGWTAEVTLTPFANYDQSIKILHKVAEHPVREGASEEQQQADEAIKTTLKETVAYFDTLFWKYVYTAFFVFSLFILNGTAFFISVIFARFLLSEIVATGRLLSVGALFIVEAEFLLVGSTLYLILISLLSFPAMWLTVPAAFFMGTSGKVGFIFTFGLIAAAGGLIWFLGSAALKLIVCIAFGPLLLASFISLLSVIIIFNRRFLQWIVCNVLFRIGRSDRPLVAAFTILTFVALAYRLMVHGTE